MASLPPILASASPRRRELLAQLLERFEVDPADVDEEALATGDPWHAAERIAAAKADFVSARHPGRVTIGADTLVALREGEVWTLFGKPVDDAEAARTLAALSGRTHLVITGLALRGPGIWRTFSETTEVTFRTLAKEEVRAYVATGEPRDKAGAYAIQGGAAAFVSSVRGSRSNVIGLPLEALGRALREVPLG